MNKQAWFLTAVIMAVIIIIEVIRAGGDSVAAAEYDGTYYDEYYDEYYDANTWTYVRIDLSAQWLTVVSGGETVFEAPVVTGTAGTSRATPTGLYSIDSKETCRVLRGADYASYVDYWMPFNGGIGMHDATWRSDDEFAYGGETYLWNGSHGCINMRHDDAATVYSLVSVGDNVIVTE